jgi:ATP-dependent DNA helicase DinG
VRASFAPDGPLARTLAGFEPRAAQEQMAAAVASALESGGVLLAEAGTGTGKTLAYLIPAILSRRRVLISTGTKNLQEQIYFKDLPALRRALGVRFTATYLKGRSNYLCLHRFGEFQAAPKLRDPSEVHAIEIVQDWARRTSTGDRAEMQDLPEDLPFWSEISATNENCLGTKCPHYQDCFVTRARQEAADADLVIVNHHLLCADAAVRQGSEGGVIPDFHHVIIDEAHQLEEVATQYFGLAVSTYRLEELGRDGLRAAAGLPDPGARDELSAALHRLRDLADQFFQAVSFHVWERAALPGATPITSGERVRLQAEVSNELAAAAARLTTALRGLQGTIELMKSPPEDARAVGRRAGDLAGEIEFILRAEDGEFVYYAERRGRGIFLRAAPINVSALLRDLVLDRLHATVLTSATLAVERSFEYIRGRLGVGPAEELRLPSEFDYHRQALLYLPARMPDPRTPGFVRAAAREVMEILTRTRGRAFVLFTSYTNLRQVHALVSGELPYPVLVQGSAPRSVLLQRFRSTPHAVLFATSSFWQGVDVAGDALSCVIIDRLPFASPGDPVTAARLDAVARTGGSPFTDFQVPLAILALLQGLGRLIRHRDDRGILAILDPRLRTSRYGARFLASLPPAPITDDLTAIARFMQD